MNIDCEWFQAQLEPYINSDRWLIAYSGGLDSSVLLRLMVEIRNSSDSLPHLEAIHVNHGLNARADQWQLHCIQRCIEYQVPLTVVGADVSNQGLGLEAAARQARYKQLEKVLASNDLLIMAHHLDDQIETFFLRLLRGAGVDGLAAMPSLRDLGDGQIFRPLLTVPRIELERFAIQSDLRWVEDDSNRDTDFDRNFLRSEVLPIVQQRWPGYRKTVARAVNHMADSRQRISGLSATKLKICESKSRGQTVLLLDLLLDYDNLLVASILRSWLSREQFSMPRSEQLKEFLKQLRHKLDATSPILHGQGYEIRHFQHKLYLLSPAVDFDTTQVLMVEVGQALSIDGVGTVKIETPHSEAHDLALQFRIEFRKGGERCQPNGRKHSQSLKKLMQEYLIEPWWRARVPLIYLEDRLLAVGDYWICEIKESDVELPRLKVSWTRSQLNNQN